MGSANRHERNDGSLTKEWCFLRRPLSNNRTATEERCFLCSQCRGVSGTSWELESCPSRVEWNELAGDRASQRTAAVQSL
jgi:hypothetical protein